MRGGLYNRQVHRLYLEPFHLYEVEAFLQSKNIHFSHEEIAQCYMILGGVPAYLNQLEDGYPLDVNIDRLFFQEKGSLQDGFSYLFRTLFPEGENALWAVREHAIKVLEVLSRKQRGLTWEEIVQVIGLPGNVSRGILGTLLGAGLVRESLLYGYSTKNRLYQLSDPFTLFYFRFVRDQEGIDEHFWSHSQELSSRRAWEDFAFEMLCKDHIPQIKQRLGIAGVITKEPCFVLDPAGERRGDRHPDRISPVKTSFLEEYSWFTREDKELAIAKDEMGLLIERRDHILNVCEMKYTDGELVLDEEYEAALRRKISTFAWMTQKNGLQVTMLTPYGLKRNWYSQMVHSLVTWEDLFCPPFTLF